MARDETLIDRMYGGDAPSPRRPPGVVPALWLAGFVLLGTCALAVSVVSGAAISLGYADNELVQWGVLAPDERVLAYAGPEDDQGTTGCALVSTGHVVQWADRAPRARVDVRAGGLRVDGSQLTATSADGATLTCNAMDQGNAFVERARPFVDQPHPKDHPARDPRVDAFRRSYE